LDANIKSYQNFNPDSSRLALMPGSRLAEIDTLWKPMQRIAVDLRRKYPNLKVTTVAVDSNKELLLKARQILGFHSEYSICRVYETARRSDLAMVASGSATLQVAAAGCPMIVMYQSSKFLWHTVGRWLINIKHLSLPNILANKTLVPEFMPYFTSTTPILKAADHLLRSPAELANISRQLISLVKPLAVGNTADRVAGIACQMLH
jgi:lipid-A-disaccharide synthase